MTTVTLSLPRGRRIPVLRRIAFSAGLALVMWSSSRQARPAHDDQARRIATETAVQRTRDSFRYGIAQ